MANKECDLIKELKFKSKELSEWLRANFNPHTSILIDDSGVKLLTTDYFVPNQFCDKGESYRV